MAVIPIHGMGEICDVSNLIEEYIECPEENLIQKFKHDQWGLTDIFRVCDRRIGKRRFRELLEAAGDKKIKDIILKQLSQVR